MNADRLLALYERVADAEDAVPRLRRFVLDLAVRGKLLEQDPADQPASKALERMHAGRKHRRAFARIDPTDDSALLPAIPATWVWATTDQLCADDENAITDGPFGSQLKTEHYIQEPGFRVIRLQNIGPGFFRDEHRSYIDASRYSKLTKHSVVPGDLVVAGLVDPSVRCCEVPYDIGPAVVKADCYRYSVHPILSSRFILFALNSPLTQELATVHHHGMTLTRIGLGNFRKIAIPLPPLAEQRRIVAKVDELMALLDRLEAARAAREATRDRLAAAALARLTAPEPNAETARTHARFATGILPALTTRPDQIKALRQTILNLAVRGKLVEQDPAEEPASVMIKRFHSHRHGRRAGRDWSTTQGRLADQALELPHGWCWTTVDEVARRVTVGYVGPMKDQYVANGIPFLRSQNVRANRFRQDGLTFVSPAFHEKIIKSALAPGDVVVVRSGNVGTACVIPSSLPVANCSDLVVVQGPECVVPEFLSFYLNSLASAHVEEGSVGMALTHFNGVVA